MREPVRRIFDVATALLVLVVSSPVLAIACLAVVLETRGGALYRQRRVGLHGREFDVLKLRTMVSGAEHLGAGLAVDAGDARITRVGAILRRTSIDELPNLINVLRGEMSIIGPRPTVPSQVAEYTDRQLGRLELKPGITGWAQVHGRAALPWPQRIELDLWYAEHRSTRIDFQILGRTLLLVVGGDGLYRGSTGGWNPTTGEFEPASEEERNAAQVFRRRRMTAAAVVVVAVAVLAGVVSALGGTDEEAQSKKPDVRAFAVAPPAAPSWLVHDVAVRDAQKRLSFVARGGDNRKEIALTFDDGPTPFTTQILKILKRYDAHGTFFQYGTQVNLHPEITYAMARTPGVEIGNHTQLHPRLDLLSKGEQERNIIDGAQTIINSGARPPRLFRPPYGATNADTYKILDKVHELSVMWSVDSQDYTRPGAQAIADGVVRGAHPGAIVLMHDGPERRDQTVAALPSILKRLKKQGYRFVTVSELLVDNPPPTLSEDAVPEGAPGAG